MIRNQDSDRSNKAFSALIRRETIILIVLAAATVPLFLFTRKMAAWNRERNVAAGRAWYERAHEPLRQGESITAVEYLRKASAADRDNVQYSLSLAEELTSAGETDEARQILLRLRSFKPEDGRINLDLARISVKNNEAEDARKYYHQALYGSWPAGQAIVEQARIRTEFVRYLVTERDTSNAVSELLILAAGSPADAASNTELGRLFLQVDEPVRALNEFLGALKLEPMNAEALAGAGEAEFRLGNDDAAKKQLQSAAALGPLSAEAQRAFTLSGLILSNDPLASGIGAHERARRLTEAFRQAGERLGMCIRQSAVAEPAAAEMIKVEMARMEKQISRNGAGTELNLLRDGLKIASRAETAGNAACGSRSDDDEAIVLAAERHKVNTP